MSLGRPAIELAFLPIMFFAVLRAEHLEKQKSLVVSVNGSTEYKSVQQAVDALPQEGGVIKILPGNYRVVTINKPHVRMEGDKADPTKVVIVFNNSHGKVGSTLKSATVSVLGDDFFAEGITFANDFSAGKPLAPEGSQAVALLVKGDAQTISRIAKFMLLHTRQFFLRHRVSIILMKTAATF
jgi:pectin methylesterase-like acyl-CoA thioesterase